MLNSNLKNAIFLLLFFTGIFSLLLTAQAYYFPDHFVYAEIPLEMQKRHNWITPYLNGLPYIEGPHLYFWLQLIAIQCFGVHSLAFRLWSVIGALSGILLTYQFGQRFHSKQAGLLSASLVGFSSLYVIWALSIGPYMVGSVLFASALFSFYYATRQIRQPSERSYFQLFWILAGVLVLATSWVITGLLFIILVLWSYKNKQTHYISHGLIPSGMVLFIFISIPWYILLDKDQVSLFDVIFGSFYSQNTFSTSPGHSLILLGLLFFPWTFLLAMTVWRNFNYQPIDPEEKQQRSLLGMTLFILACYLVISKNFLSGWLLLLVIPTALFMGYHFTSYWRTHKNKIYKPIYSVQFTFMLLVTGLLFTVSHSGKLNLDVKAYEYLNILSFSLLLLLGLSIVFLFKKKSKAALFVILVASMSCAIALPLIIRLYGNASNQALINTLQPYLKNDDVIVNYHDYLPEVAFLLEKPVVVIDWQHPPRLMKLSRHKGGLSVSQKTFWPYWHEKKYQFFMFIPKKEFQTIKANTLANHDNSFYYIAGSEQTVLISNYPLRK